MQDDSLYGTSNHLSIPKVAAKRREKKEAILAAFQRIPETIEKAEHCRERFPDDEKMYDLTSDLYLAVLDAITSMIKWLVGDSFCEL